MMYCVLKCVALRLNSNVGVVLFPAVLQVCQRGLSVILFSIIRFFALLF